MAYLQWTNDLNTGIEVIDKQHRRLVEYLNELNLAIIEHDQKAVKHVLDELIDYTLSHFSFEEELLEKSGYPFFKAHKRVHEIFTKRVGQFLERAAKGEDVAPEILSMLKIWLVNHIKGDDADYVEIVLKSLGLEAKISEPTGGWLGSAIKKFFG
jgi:hemerythrin